MHLVDPTHEPLLAPAPMAPRPAVLAGGTVGIVSNGKANTRPFFDHLEQRVLERWPVAAVVRLTKANYSAPAEEQLMRQSVGWAAMFAGVGD